MIPSEQNSQFVANMGRVLDVYKRPYNPDFPVVCMDESPRQMIRETRKPIPASPGHPARVDYEYERCGVYNIFMASEPLAGRRLVGITEARTKRDWAYFIENISQNYEKAKKITLVMDNLNTHKPGSLYETFLPPKANALWEKFDFVYTPKHGSWLNMAEIELNVLMSQCLSKRIDNIEKIRQQVEAWLNHRNNLKAKINWQFTTDNARIKLKRLYPTLDA